MVTKAIKFSGNISSGGDRDPSPVKNILGWSELYSIKKGLAPNISNINVLSFSKHGKYRCICDLTNFSIRGSVRKVRYNSFA